MTYLNPTPPDRLLDSHHRPYFLWDNDLTVEQLCERLSSTGEVVRAYWTLKVMRQAKPDDVFTFVSRAQKARDWSLLTRYLGEKRAFWDWWLSIWEALGHVHR